MGYEFQAELPPCFVDAKKSGVWSPDDESPREQLLWKPWDELEKSPNLQDQGRCMSNYSFTKPTLTFLLRLSQSGST